MRHQITIKITMTILAVYLLALSGCKSSEQLLDPVAYLEINYQQNKQMQVNCKAKPSPLDLVQLKYAHALGILPQTVTNLALYHFIEEWYGVRYRLGGNDKLGIDCSAFVQKLYEDVFCVNLVRTAFMQFKNCKPVKNKNELKEGDLVFFRTRGKQVSHVGIYLANNFFIHSSSSQGVTISNLYDDYWSKRFVGAGQITH